MTSATSRASGYENSWYELPMLYRHPRTRFWTTRLLIAFRTRRSGTSIVAPSKRRAFQYCSTDVRMVSYVTRSITCGPSLVDAWGHAMNADANVLDGTMNV